jgi:hypothetical protein
LSEAFTVSQPVRLSELGLTAAVHRHHPSESAHLSQRADLLRQGKGWRQLSRQNQRICTESAMWAEMT